MTDDELEEAVYALTSARKALGLEHDSTLQDLVDAVFRLCRGLAAEWERRGTGDKPEEGE